MKHNPILYVMLANAISWITTGTVAIIAINATQNAWWSFLLLIPALFGYGYKHEN